MVMIYTETGAGSSEQVLSEAQKQFHRATRALDQLVDQLDDGELGNASEAQRLLRDLKGALSLAISERERLEKQQRENAGIVNGYAIDFDAARHEIGRRLACLRAAGSSGRVSE
ncbi:MAG: hypothetical protein KDA50_13425 [Rhodobacteraceae bacterium]|nr:hypothetical protein [Paracoccaceae bacterium]